MRRAASTPSMRALETYVHQHQIRKHLRSQSHGLFTRFRDPIDFESVGAELLLDFGRNDRLVFYDENARALHVSYLITDSWSKKTE